MQNKTLWTLPPAPLPELKDVVDPVFVTIWFFGTLVLTGVFFWLRLRPKKPWEEFRTIMYGSGLMCFWYLFLVIDRWLHYDTRSVVFGYILVMPFWEAFRLISTILILWGTFTILWRDIKANSEKRNWWWRGAKFALFCVCLVSFYYWILYFALGVVWMRFYSLNIIADVATKRTNFELATTGLFFGFSLMTAVASTDAILIRGGEIDGERQQHNYVFYAATILLLLRSTLQFAAVIRAFLPDYTRQDTMLFSDISEGLLSLLYLMTMAFLAWTITKGKVKETSATRPVKAEVLKYVLGRLKEGTTRGRSQAPPFASILDELSTNLNEVLLSFSEEDKMIAKKYIRFLRRKFGTLNPRDGVNFRDVEKRNISAITNFTDNLTIFGRRSASGGNTVSPAPLLNGDSRSTHSRLRPMRSYNSNLTTQPSEVQLTNMARTRPSVRSNYSQIPQADVQPDYASSSYSPPPPPPINYGSQPGAWAPAPSPRPSTMPVAGYGSYPPSTRSPSNQARYAALHPHAEHEEERY
ncbi:hypothetical protein FALBO_5373 [Fusarium albosuccineum]|uniref:Uncharacterized protein n=1 Tax=Fusarium albosuccineum TaxID=1237068 RepID=A0A8H4LGR2_9HYPO|nr:hypothetical protein FALBO_5373 [Fusarium albosuccineum]